MTLALVVATLAALALGIYAVLDLALTPAELVSSLSKPVWFLLLLLPVLGPLAWLTLGRPSPPATDRPGPLAPDDDPEFLARLRLKRPRSEPEES